MDMDLKLFDIFAYPWLVTLLGGTLAIIAALALNSILFVVLRRVTRFSTVMHTVVQFIAAPSRLVMPLIALQIVLEAAPPDLLYRARVAHLLTIALMAAWTWLAVRAIAGVGDAIIRLNPADVTDNLHARRIQTQTRVLTRTAMFFVLLVGAAGAFMTFPGMRQIGASLLASAGVAGLVAGIAARPVFGSLIAGLQIALTQPIRIDDVVIIENEWGRIEEITSTYVVVKIWDERRLVVPLQWIIQNPFQNWTRRGSQLLGTVTLWADYRVPLAAVREALDNVCRNAPEWDGRVALLQVVEANEKAIQLRALVSAADASKAWDLRCRVREALIDLLQREYPDALPRLRAELESAPEPGAAVPAPPPLRAGKGDSSAIKEPIHAEVQVRGDERAAAETQRKQ
ncbi:MAG TPA: mechanosensitive ion channel domain-containing protein [Burkholderiales bacterium]|nr:mechanosensitive ion channel domain-containing protein [Burkholderiales bacterium]